MPSKGAKKVLDLPESDDRKKAKSSAGYHALEAPGKRLVRVNPPTQDANEIIGFDQTYQLRVAGKAGGEHGIYVLEADTAKKRKTISFDVRRLSDYDMPMKDRTGKLTGRRPKNDFRKFEDIMKTTDKKWEDDDSPQLKNVDSKKEAFTYKRPEEVFPGQEVTMFVT